MAVLIHHQKPFFINLQAFGCIHQTAARPLADGNDYGIRLSLQQFLGLAAGLAVFIKKQLAEKRPLLVDFHNLLAKLKLCAIQLSVKLLLAGAAGLVAPAVKGHLLCAVAQTGAGHIHCGVAHTDNGHALAQIVLARVGQIINAKKHVAAAFSLNTQGARPPNAGADKNGPIIIAEKVINAQSVANGGV